MPRWRDSKIVRIIGILWIVGFVVFVVWHEIAYAPATRAKIPELEAESALIAAPTEDRLVDKRTTHKSGQVLVDRSYTSSLTYQQLRSHYDAQLAAHGWTFGREKPLRDWGRDLGGKVACYRKGEDVCDLQYAGERANYGWTYSLSFTWGLGRCGPSGSNQALERTADRRISLLSMTSPLKREAKVALVSGRSAWSR